MNLAMRVTLAGLLLGALAGGGVAVSMETDAGPIVPPALAGLGQALCNAAEVDLLLDGSDSVDDEAFARQAKVAVGAALEFQGCDPQPRVMVGAFSEGVSQLEPFDFQKPLAQLTRLRSQLAVEWTNPVAAVATVQEATAGEVGVVVITDGAIEPGPQDGPPADVAAFVGELEALQSAGPLVLWAVRSSVDASFSSTFGPIWDELGMRGLGVLDVAPQGTAIVPPFRAVRSAPTDIELEPTATPVLQPTVVSDPLGAVVSVSGESLHEFFMSGRGILLFTFVGALWGVALLVVAFRFRKQAAPSIGLQVRRPDGKTTLLQLVQGEPKDVPAGEPNARKLVLQEDGSILVDGRDRILARAGTFNLNDLYQVRRIPPLGPSTSWESVAIEDNKPRNLAEEHWKEKEVTT